MQYQPQLVQGDLMKMKLMTLVGMALLGLGTIQAHAVVCQVVIATSTDGSYGCVAWKCSDGNNGISCGALSNALNSVPAQPAKAPSDLTGSETLAINGKTLNLFWAPTPSASASVVKREDTPHSGL
jgi:hypothetical protein